MGGDGTVADVAGALAGGPVALAPLPGGNANVFARAIGWPAAAPAAIPLLGRALDRTAVREASLGLLHIDGHARVFAINCGMGLDAATVEWIEARPRTKRRLRQAGFAIGAAVAAVRSRRVPRLAVEVNGVAGRRPSRCSLPAGRRTPTWAAGRSTWPPARRSTGGSPWVALTRARPHELGRLAARAVRGRELPLDGPALRGGRAPTGLVDPLAGARPCAGGRRGAGPPPRGPRHARPGAPRGRSRRPRRSTRTCPGTI